MREFLTKTLKCTKVHVKVVNKETDQVEVITITLERCYSKGKIEQVTSAVIKYLRNNPKYILVKVQDYFEEKQLRGISEEIFNKYSVELDPKTRAPLNK